jgi:hypothetical protein
MVFKVSWSIMCVYEYIYWRIRMYIIIFFRNQGLRAWVLFPDIYFVLINMHSIFQGQYSFRETFQLENQGAGLLQ